MWVLKNPKKEFFCCILNNYTLSSRNISCCISLWVQAQMQFQTKTRNFYPCGLLACVYIQTGDKLLSHLRWKIWPLLNSGCRDSSNEEQKQLKIKIRENKEASEEDGLWQYSAQGCKLLELDQGKSGCKTLSALAV